MAKSSLDINEHERGKYLYHYTSLDTALNFILKTKALRFSPYKYVNDPLEFKKWKFELAYNKEKFSDFDFSDVESALDSVGTILIEHSKILCFSRDYPSNHPLTDNAPNDFYSRNWARGYGYPRMWAQYGDSHKGACLVFEKQKLIQAIDEQFKDTHKILHAEVVYGIYTSKDSSFPYHVALSQELLEDFNEGINKHLEKNRLGVFFLKALDWINEVEYRWVLNSANKDYEFCKFGDSLAGIVLGSEAEFDPQNFKDSNCAIYSIKWEYLNPSIEKIKRPS